MCNGSVGDGRLLFYVCLGAQQANNKQAEYARTKVKRETEKPGIRSYSADVPYYTWCEVGLVVPYCEVVSEHPGIGSVSVQQG